ncbi:MAG: DNA topoisomerase IV subunit A [Sphingomonadales bacterium RIFCSPHIGHO2_01_FULL_65_20]|uniref:DNA topoisomerase 4 subunit A n=1 Tax=Sphingomonas ursincola TaxID=56361 RepID=A0A7V8RE77_9SPHN|nr:DNA topoisomerase IV subunit A [Sphingomonas ursincola]MBA1374789.1 DNA topoisomerase IV subunit A [Sphingomonas ursincola]MBY0619173.1 DNA topoisomerase IV subunit A [Sphingomonas ursincola]MCH2239489.1 DNA topoisomerase IV subunit A [Blastomonas sp.]OHC94559.1 MAG: DNA topoisomerase IV subunit A [Sphingomonadales bacterium RIFCSPHIGHO2_01_FULL_65_20]
MADEASAGSGDDIPEIENTSFDRALSDRYLVYALSTITARSLPDLRDGLKPVHRRLLWAMRQLKLDPASGYKKSARVVGDVIGKYHPHGDASVYDAMVRLAQDFVLRYPLVDGQGNFGNIDGDNAAAYRYTEARLTRTAIELMAGLDEGTVAFKPTYNGEEEEPEVFPGLFPNLLANGASGIAVGMATSIPSHNVLEIIDAAMLLIKKPEATHEDIMTVFLGPDFATGGVLVDSAESISQAYRTGRGAFRLRARYSTGRDAEGNWEPTGIEKLPGGTWQLIISEIPYQVQKGKLIEQIATLIAEKKLPILADVRDESDETIRLVIEPKSRNVDVDILKDSLYRLTDLEIRFPLNLNVLDETRTPGVMGIKPLLESWLRHQILILVNRSRHRLDKIAARLELLRGYIIAYLNLDRVIEIIRTEDEPKPVMMAEFELTDRQAEAILNMRLRSLRKLEEMELRREHDALIAEQAELEELLADPKLQKQRLTKNLKALRALYSGNTELGRLGARRTKIEEAAPAREIPLEAMIEREPVTVIMSRRGWIKAMKGHADLSAAELTKFKEGDGPGFAFHAQSTDKLLFALDNGRFYTLGAEKLPGARGFGEPVRGMLDMENEAQIVALLPYDPQGKLLLAASNGRGFLAEMAELIAETRKGRQVVNLKAGVKLMVIRPVPPSADHVAVVGENRKLVVFPIAELPVMARGQGVQLQRYRDGSLSDATTFRLEEGLSWTMGGDSGRVRTEKDMGLWRVARGAAGRLPPNGFPRSNKFDG